MNEILHLIFWKIFLSPNLSTSLDLPASKVFILRGRLWYVYCTSVFICLKLVSSFFLFWYCVSTESYITSAMAIGFWNSHFAMMSVVPFACWSTAFRGNWRRWRLLRHWRRTDFVPRACPHRQLREISWESLAWRDPPISAKNRLKSGPPSVSARSRKTTLTAAPAALGDFGNLTRAWWCNRSYSWTLEYLKRRKSAL